MIFRSINLNPSGIRLVVNAKDIVLRLVDHDKLSADHVDHRVGDNHEHDDETAETVTFEYPVSLRRRGVGTKIVIDSPYVQPEPDSSLVDLIARAHVYLNRLAGSSNMSTGRIATAFGVDRADVGRILPLAFLSPAMLDVILTGRQSASLSARRLARMDLPTIWADQESTLQ